MSSLGTKIGKQVNQMTKSQKKVANYLLYNMDKLLFFTADELAKAADVSTATVVRFARELDFEGYTDMQKEARLRFHDKEEQPEDPDEETPSKPDDSSSSEGESSSSQEEGSSSEEDSSSSQDSSSSGTGSGSSSDSSQESSSSSEETSHPTTDEDSEAHQAPGP